MSETTTTERTEASTPGPGRHRQAGGAETAKLQEAPDQAGRLRRPRVNITPQERWARVLMGAIGVAWSAVLLAAAAGALAVVLEVLLVAAGADLVVTGALGHCPVYAKLGHVPRSLGARP